MDGEVFFLLYVAFTFCQIIYVTINDVPRYVGGEDDITSVQRENCSELNTCEYSKKVYVPNCYCDVLCHIYEDCCIDHVISEEEQHSATIQETQDKMRSLNQDCMTLYGYDIGAYIIRHCPSNAQNETVDVVQSIGGTTIFDILPVISSDNITYRNKYIAECNNATKYVFWKILFDVSFCSQEYDFKLSSLTTMDIANYYVDEGCEFNLLPPDETLPRFCLIYNPADDVTVSKKVPVRNSFGIFRNEESCRRYMQKEVKCNICNKFEFDETLALKFGNSMNVLFTFSAGRETEGEDIEKTHTDLDVIFRNFRLKRLMRAATPNVFKPSEWNRAAFFYQQCVKRALRYFKPYFEFYHMLYFEYQNSTNSGFLKIDFDIVMENELHSHVILSKINTWLDEQRIQYLGVSDNGTARYDIVTSRLDLSPGVRCPECFIEVKTRTQSDNSDEVVRLMTISNEFPSLNCFEIHGRATILTDTHSFSVNCNKYHSMVPNSSQVLSLSISLSVLLSLASICLCSILTF